MISILLNWLYVMVLPYAIDFCNPAPDAERTSVGEENFSWVVETAATFAIEKAKAWKKERTTLPGASL